MESRKVVPSLTSFGSSFTFRQYLIIGPTNCPQVFQWVRNLGALPLFQFSLIFFVDSMAHYRFQYGCANDRVLESPSALYLGLIMHGNRGKSIN